MPHVHFPLQSGSDRILRAMHRPYTAARYEGLIDQLRQARPGMAVTTDIIVGFPGETEEDYQQTRALVDRISFDNAFVFRYSPRKDTPAATMDGQLSEEVKEARNHDLLSVVNAHAKAKLVALVGRARGNPLRRPEQDQSPPSDRPHAGEQDRRFRGPPAPGRA